MSDTKIPEAVENALGDVLQAQFRLGLVAGRRGQQAITKDAPEVSEASRVLLKLVDALRAALSAPAEVVNECLDTDSPWLICKPCAKVGRCAMHAAPAAPAGWREAVQRLVTGFEHVSGIARQWEPDHSSGADRAKWARATEACADVAKLLAAAPGAQGDAL